MIVAWTTSRFGGKCDCGHRVPPDAVIGKADLGDRGSQTSGGNGRGVWLCGPCALAHDDAERRAS